MLIARREGRTWGGPWGGASSCEGHAPLLEQAQLLCNACTAAGADVRCPLERIPIPMCALHALAVRSSCPGVGNCSPWQSVRLSVVVPVCDVYADQAGA